MNSLDENVVIFGIDVCNYSSGEAIDLIELFIKNFQGRSRSIFIVNAHTMNLVCKFASYRTVIASASRILADGTGLRWAARLRGVVLKDNLVGTDLLPRIFNEKADLGYRYFLLGADENTINRAADYCRSAFPGWELSGYHHGYLGKKETLDVIEDINKARPDLLLVGMGNPKQEYWIHENLGHLRVPVCIGVGGLFDHWGGNLSRAPLWVRRRGFEWLQLLIQQPHKWRRYILGNPAFLMRIVFKLPKDRMLQLERTGEATFDEQGSRE